MKLSKIYSKLIAHIELQFSDYACLITGSFVDDDYNAQYSDIDVLVFVNDRCIGYNEMIDIEGIKYQLIIIPITSVTAIIRRDYTSNTGVYINMIEKGVIIKHIQQKFLKNLQNSIRQLYLKGPSKWNEDELYTLKSRTTSLLYDVLGAKNTAELYFTIMELESKLTSLVLLSNGFWNGNVKYQYRNINSCSSEFFKQLKTSHIKYYAENDINPIVKLTRSVLNDVGGEMPYFSHIRILSKVSYNYLVFNIGINDFRNSIELNNSIISIKNYIKEYGVKNSYVFRTRTDDKSELCMQLQYVIHANATAINNYIIPKINKIIEDKKVYIYIPLRNNPAHPFSQIIYKAITPIFDILSDIFIKNGVLISKENQIIYFLSIVEFLHTQFNNQEEFISFMHFYRNCIAVVPYELNFNIRDISSYTNIILNDYARRYSSFKSIIQSLNNNKNDIIKKEINKVLSMLTKPKIINLFKNYDSLEYCFDNSSFNYHFKIYKEIFSKIMDMLFLDEYEKEFFVYSILKMIDENMFNSYNKKS